jgi:hypothetical protein
VSLFLSTFIQGEISFTEIVKDALSIHHLDSSQKASLASSSFILSLLS